MKISDELRRVADEWDVTPLYALADRIDAEMVELPRDRDGVPIRVEDTVYGDEEDGPEVVTCVGIVSTCHGWMVWAPVARCPDELTHIRPDSFKRIADELEEWCDDVDVDEDACGKPRDLADRIRKLAKRED